jgi:hypothetical protein
MNAYLTHSGFIVPANIIQLRFGAKSNDLFKKLTIVRPQKVGPPKRAVLYSNIVVNNVNCILFPRTLLRIFLSTRIVDSVEVLLEPPRLISAELTIELYANQHILIDHLMGAVYTPERITRGTAACILNLRAGMGKTFIAGGVVARLGMRTLYIVPKRPLALQAVKDLRACFYDSTAGITIGMYGKTAKKSDPSSVVEKQDITVIVINSALGRDSTFFRGYSCVVLDEVHSYCSEQRRGIFRAATARAMLGMSEIGRASCRERV